MTFRTCLRFALACCCGAGSLTGSSYAEPPNASIHVAWQVESVRDANDPIAPVSSPSVPAWIPAMREVHGRFTGKPGTFAQFGDSISVSMAFWTPLGYEPQGMTDALKSDWKLVKEYQAAECWREWKGPEFGNEGRMTVRWAHDNIDRWLKMMNPEVAVILFGSNDLTEMSRKEYSEQMAVVVDRCLQNGTIVILTTPPPRAGMVDQAREFAQAVRRVATELRVPLIDYQAEILRRRPDDWDGSLEKFDDVPGDTYNVPTLIARDGLHPSNPEEYQQFSEAGLSHNGYLLRNAMTLSAYAAIIRAVLEGP